MADAGRMVPRPGKGKKMTDLDVVLSEINSIKGTLSNHGVALKELADATTKMAVQNEQIVGIQNQLIGLWRQMDDLTGKDGSVTRLKEHQGQCPKEEMHRTFRWLWAAMGVHSAALLALLAAIMKVTG